MKSPPPTRRGPHLLTLLVLLLLTGALAAAQRREDSAPAASVTVKFQKHIASIIRQAMEAPDHRVQMVAPADDVRAPVHVRDDKARTQSVTFFDRTLFDRPTTSTPILPDDGSDASPNTIATEPTAAQPTVSGESTGSNSNAFGDNERPINGTVFLGDLEFTDPATSIPIGTPTSAPTRGAQLVSGTTFGTGPVPVTYSYAWPTASATTNLFVALALLLATALVVERLLRSRLRLSLAELLLAVTVAAFGLFIIRNNWHMHAVANLTLPLRIILFTAAYCAYLVPAWILFQLLRLVLNNRHTRLPASSAPADLR